jgi:hypothetical protein
VSELVAWGSHYARGAVAAASAVSSAAWSPRPVLYGERGRVRGSERVVCECEKSLREWGWTEPFVGLGQEIAARARHRCWHAFGVTFTLRWGRALFACSPSARRTPSFWGKLTAPLIETLPIPTTVIPAKAGIRDTLKGTHHLPAQRLDFGLDFHRWHKWRRH